MRILSNDDPANVPGADSVTHGGKVIFARNFSDFAVEEGHEWIGLIQRRTKSNRIFMRTLAAASHRRYEACFTPEQRFAAIFKIEHWVDAREYFSEEIKRLRRFIRETQPNILFLNGYGVIAWLLLEAATHEQLPIVIQHAGIAHIEYGMYDHIYSEMARKIFLEMERDIVRQASKQVFLNDYSRRTFSEKVLQIPQGQSVIIPLPYGADRWERMPKFKKDGLTIGCVARWDRIKNHAAVLDVAREAQAQGLPWRFKSVTTIPPSKLFRGFKDEYAARITVIPPMECAALKEFYREVDLCILPSFFDVSPTVVLEAAGAGKPTLISPTVGWVSEYQACHMDKWIMDFSDPKAVVARLRALVTKPPPTAFQTFVRRHHDPKRVFRAYLQLFSRSIHV